MRGTLAVLALVGAGVVFAQPSDDAERSAADGIDPAVDFSRDLEPASAETAPERTETAASSAAASAASGAIDTLDLGTTSITGNRELPRVLYIVPWKESALGDLVGRPVDTLLDEVLAPVDPDVFSRHVSYYESLYGESQEELSQ